MPDSLPHCLEAGTKREWGIQAEKMDRGLGAHPVFPRSVSVSFSAQGTLLKGPPRVRHRTLPRLSIFFMAKSIYIYIFLLEVQKHNDSGKNQC